MCFILLLQYIITHTALLGALLFTFPMTVLQISNIYTSDRTVTSDYRSLINVTVKKRQQNGFRFSRLPPLFLGLLRVQSWLRARGDACSPQTPAALVTTSVVNVLGLLLASPRPVTNSLFLTVHEPNEMQQLLLRHPQRNKDSTSVMCNSQNSRNSLHTLLLHNTHAYVCI